MRILGREVVAVFADALALLRYVEDFAVITLAVEEIFAPGNAVTDLERIAAHVGVDAVADVLNAADDLVSENSRTRVRPAAFVRMNVGTADRRHRHPHQHFAALCRTHGKFLEHERRVGCFVNGGLGGTHDVLQSCYAIGRR
jgi:hypothetical protein